MTKEFDRKLEQNLKSAENFFDFYSTDEIPEPRSLFVRRGKVKEARPFIAAHHYTHIMPDSTKEVCMGYYDDVLAVICVFGMGKGKNQYIRLIPDLQDGEYRELTRLWSPDNMPKNTESKLISTSLKMLPKEVKIVLSYADPGQNHLGTIYQATNWYYIGRTSGGQKMINHLGEEVHPRLVSMYKLRHPEKYGQLTMRQIMDKLGWEYDSGTSKYRYCYLRGNRKEKKQMKEKIKDIIQEYPLYISL
jgi:hypothetical protein